ncbi:MAG: hypothetical protein QNK23_07640 [Crocinitomicaceae bacterium]|nr:hypothetical protein [Crocinitomicaceae bacterium]
MKKLLTLLLLVLTTSTLHSQMPKSKELGKYDGIPAINITKNYPKEINGLTLVSEGEVIWSTLKDRVNSWQYVMLGDPKALNYEGKYGLKVVRIEIFCRDGYDEDMEEMSSNLIAIYGVSVFFELPKTSDEVADFMSGFIDLHGSYMTSYRETELGEVEMFMWHSSNECGAMMELPKAMSLEQCESDGHKYIELRFIQSCGG